MHYEIDTGLLFPPDDTGDGFDNIADVLTLSPLLMEKYINAATEIVEARVPVESKVPEHRGFLVSDFEIVEKVKARPAALANEDKDSEADDSVVNPVEPAEVSDGALRFFYSGGGKVKLNFDVPHTGHYKLLLILKAGEDYVEGAIDENRCQVKVVCDGEVTRRKGIVARRMDGVQLHR